ncbi:collagen-like triple helix repeat-containing protein, partial [Paraburkholderia sp. SIMBA_050]
VGGASGLGVPVDNLLTKLGNTVATGGSMLSNADKPIVSPLGGVVTETGKTVAAAGVLLNNRNGTAGGAAGAGGNPLGGLINSLPLAGAAGGSAG